MLETVAELPGIALLVNHLASEWKAFTMKWFVPPTLPVAITLDALCVTIETPAWGTIGPIARRKSNCHHARPRATDDKRVQHLDDPICL